jgi:hypothetical protein
LKTRGPFGNGQFVLAFRLNSTTAKTVAMSAAVIATIMIGKMEKETGDGFVPRAYMLPSFDPLCKLLR